MKSNGYSLTLPSKNLSSSKSENIIRASEVNNAIFDLSGLISADVVQHVKLSHEALYEAIFNAFWQPGLLEFYTC